MKFVREGDKYTPYDGELLMLVIRDKEIPVRFEYADIEDQPLCTSCPMLCFKLSRCCSEWIRPYDDQGIYQNHRMVPLEEIIE